MAIWPKSQAFLGNLTLAYLGPRLLLNLEPKVSVFFKRKDPSPLPAPYHITHQANNYPNQDLLYIWESGRLHSVWPKCRYVDCHLAQPRWHMGKQDCLTLRVLTLHLPRSTPTRVSLIPRIQTLPQPLTQSVLI